MERSVKIWKDFLPQSIFDDNKSSRNRQKKKYNKNSHVESIFVALQIHQFLQLLMERSAKIRKNNFPQFIFADNKSRNR